MATNFFFNNFTNSQEQILLEDLIIESIKIYGLDMIYLPRNTGSVDVVWSEDARRNYTTAIPVELYIKNVEGYIFNKNYLKIIDEL